MTESLKNFSKNVGLRISADEMKKKRKSWKWCWYIPGWIPSRSSGKLTYLLTYLLTYACSVFRWLQTAWASKLISLTVKLRLYNSIDHSTALYAYETWTFTTKVTNLVDFVYLSCLCKILNISLRDKIQNDKVLSRTESRIQIVAKRLIRLIVHNPRLPELWLAKIAMKMNPT